MEIKSAHTAKSVGSRKVTNGPIVLICPKHQNRLIEKICTESSCKFDILLCTDCIENSQMHICLHKDSVMSFEEFINTCKSLSLTHKYNEGTGISDKENRLLLDLDKLIISYKGHLKREEDKIDKDFNEIILSFTQDMNEIKTKLKDNLYQNLEVLVSQSTKLRESTRDIQNEKISNLQIKNEFDTFINSLNTATNGKKNFCIKKMVTEVMRVLNNTNSLKNRSLNALSCNSSIINQSQSINRSMISEKKSEILANFTSLNQNCEILANDVYSILDNKPYYKNKGDAKIAFQEAQNSLRAIYYGFKKSAEEFVKFTNSKDDENQTYSKTQVNKFTSQNDLKIVQIEKPTALDNIKKIETSHSKGINCLVVCNETLITGSLDRTIKSFCLETFSSKGSVTVGSDVISLCKVPKKNWVLAGCFKVFYAIDDDLKILHKYESEYLGVVNAIKALKDGMTAVTNAQDGKLLFWNLESENIVKKAFDHRDIVYCIETQEAKNLLVSGGLDRAIKIWKLKFQKDDFKNGILDKISLDNSIEKAHNTDITALKMSNHNPNILLSSSSNGEVKLWETLHGTLVRSFKNQNSWIYSIKIFEKESSFVKRISSPMSPNKKTWKYLSPSKRIEKENQAKVEIKDFYFLTASYDGNLKFWDSSSQNPLFNQDSQNFHDCFPYGGVEVYKNDQLKSQMIFTSGNKGDTSVNAWILK